MGFFQKAVETYDCHAHLAGQYRENCTVLAPVSHSVIKASLEITVDKEGNFVSARVVDNSEPKILIPVTQESAGRAGKKIAAHPLCDKLEYLSPCFPPKYEDYINKLTRWADSEYSHPMLKPILTYVEKGTILDDLANNGCIERTQDGSPKDKNLKVCWKVLDEACWANQELIQAFCSYNQAQMQTEDKKVCMITGENSHIAQQHPKGVIEFKGNAKLISSNDDSGFTYRGRFTEDWQAATIGYEASQKAHNAIRWLVSEQGVVCGERTFLSWNPQGKAVCSATGVFADFGKKIVEPTDYRQALKNTLDGYLTQLPKETGVVIAALDASTNGRLSLTYYQELMGSDFLNRLYNWDLHCCWASYQYGIKSPKLIEIVRNAFGKQVIKNNYARMEADDKVLGKQMQQLLACRINCTAMPWDIVFALMKKASTPLAYDGNIRENILVTACAVIRKYRYDKFKEDWEMTLEPEKQDISYQYGRLLAVFEKAEQDTYNSETDRQPTAIRQQTVFCRRPMYTAANIEKQLEQAYFPKLKSWKRSWYKKLIGQILENISKFDPSQWDRPLKETYLMGYYLQRNALYTKQTTETEDIEND